MKFLSLIAVFATTVPALPQFIDLNKDAGVGVGMHQWTLQRKVKAGTSLRAILRDWRDNLGIRVVRLNVEFTDQQFEREFMTACTAEGMTVLIAFFDHSPLGVDRYLPRGWWEKLRTIYPDASMARIVSAQLIKGMNLEDGMQFLLGRINAFKDRNASYLRCTWASAGNDVENATEYVFHNKVGEPGRGVDDTTKYAGWSLIVDKGTHNQSIRRKLEDVLGIRLPSDNEFARNTAASEERMRAAWGSRWLDGANHGYWNKTADGRPYFADVGLRQNVDVYAEFGVHNKELGGRFDLLAQQPSNARVIIFWPGDGDPFGDLLDVAAARRIIKDTSTRLTERSPSRTKNSVKQTLVHDLLDFVQSKILRNPKGRNVPRLNQTQR